MKFVADFHIHSKYSRATSPQTNLENLDKWAKIKGIKILGTGDFTHPQWLSELKEKLEPAEAGLFKLKNVPEEGRRFLLTTEISCIYSKNGRVRKIHILVFAPSLDIVEKINAQLGWIGNLKSDGRPILGLDAKELTKIVLNTSQDCLVVPAHCLLPDTYLHGKNGIKMIKDFSSDDFVFTHKGRTRRVQKIYKRAYRGKIYNIRPYYFRLGLETTTEHPFYVIKSQKYCPTMGCKAICKEGCQSSSRDRCPHKYFEQYAPQWVQAKDLEKGDVLIFPRFNHRTKDLQEIRLHKYLDKKDYKLKGKTIVPNGSRIKSLPDIIKIEKDFCRLAGYYLSEGYTDNRDSISFCFNSGEKKYIEDLEFLMEKVFSLSSPRIYKRKDTDSIEIIYFSKVLAKVFSKLFYTYQGIRRAHTKSLPVWMLVLPLEKQSEILRSWWRGDTGCTVSRSLMNQMKIICLRLGIIPSIGLNFKEKFNRVDHRIIKDNNRNVRAKHDLFHFYNLAFFKENLELLEDPIFKRFHTKLRRRHGWIDKNYIYIPIKDIEIRDYKGDVYNLEVEGDNSYLAEFAAVHNCWTPWFSLFGSKSGFDTTEECFEEYTKYIYAMETGLSSDPKMNWRLSALDKITLISNSDSHSPQKIGREANVFDTEISYPAIVGAIKTKDPQKFLYTIEFFPEEGKYHYDGHRLCGISFSPTETKKHGGICPVCGKPLVIGVLNRVEELADREIGFKPSKAIPFKSLIPLREIIGEVLHVGEASKAVDQEYDKLINSFGNELEVLIDTPIETIGSATSSELAEAISLAREGKISAIPGYDGVYGKISVFGAKREKPQISQKTLF